MHYSYISTVSTQHANISAVHSTLTLSTGFVPSIIQFTISVALIQIVTSLRGDPVTSQSTPLQFTDAAVCLLLV